MTKRIAKKAVAAQVKSGRVSAPVAEPTRTTRQNLRPGVVRYFTERPGQPVYLAEITKEIGARDEESVRSAIGHILRDRVMPVEILTRGLVWIYRPNGAVVPVSAPPAAPVSAPPARELYELIGESKDGTKVLRAEDGKLWKATEL